MKVLNMLNIPTTRAVVTFIGIKHRRRRTWRRT